MKYGIKIAENLWLMNLSSDYQSVLTFDSIGEAEEFAQNMELCNYEIDEYKMKEDYHV